MKSGRIFPGWYVAATLSVCGIALYGTGYYAFVIFVTPLSNEFGWSRAAVGMLVNAFFLAAPLALVSDRLIARFGPVRLILAGIFVESACLMLLFTASNIWEMFILRTLAGVGKILYFVSIPAILSRWFSRRFGMALAIVFCGWSLGGVLMAPISQLLIESVGWRLASTILGCSILLIALPPVLYFLRIPSAATLGLGRDGDPLEANALSDSKQELAPPQIKGLPALREILPNKAFWLCTISTALFCLSFSGLQTHQAAAIQDFGFSARAAALVVGATAGFAIFGNLLMGYLIDRLPPYAVTIIEFAFFSLGISSLLALGSFPFLWLLAFHPFIHGLAIGGFDVFLITTFRRQIPDRLFPTAYGIWYFVELQGMVFGPGIAGRIFDLSGSYRASLTAGLLNLIAPFVMFMIVASFPALAQTRTAMPMKNLKGSLDVASR